MDQLNDDLACTLESFIQKERADQGLQRAPRREDPLDQEARVLAVGAVAGGPAAVVAEALGVAGGRDQLVTRGPARHERRHPRAA